MKILIALVCTVFVRSVVAQDFAFPQDFNRKEILLYIKSYKEVIDEMSEEYERVNTKEKCEERSRLIKSTLISNDRIILGDIYGIMFDLKLVDWTNGIIEKAANKRKDKKLVIVNQTDLETFSKEKYRYFLSSKYVMDNNFPPRLQMVFYLHDRISGKDLLDYQNIKKEITFEPIVGFAAEGDVFYMTIKRFKVKGELNAFISKSL